MPHRLRPLVVIVLFSLFALGTVPAAERLPLEPLRLAESEYDAILETATVRFRQPNGVTLGPVALRLLSTAELDQYFEMIAADVELTEEELRDVLIEIKVASLPNVHHRHDLTQVRLDTVWTAAGTTAVDVEDDDVILLEVGPEPHLHGTATVRLPEGLDTSDVSGIAGTLTLHLPLDVATIEVDLAQPGGHVDHGGLLLAMVERTPTSVTFSWDGDIDRLLAVTGLDDEGRTIAPKSTWLTGRNTLAARRALETETDETARRFAQALLEKRAHFAFPASIGTVRVHVFRGFATRDYAFRLSR